MRHRRAMNHGSMRPFALAVLMAAGAAGAPALATDVYRWVDENGVTHFTENPPPGVAEERVTRADVAPIESSGIAADAAYDTEAHAARMAEWRAERDEAREAARERERERAERDARQAQPVVVQDTGRAVWWPPGYLRPPHHRPDRPPFRPPHRPPRPTPPIEPPAGGDTAPPSVLRPR